MSPEDLEILVITSPIYPLVDEWYSCFLNDGDLIAAMRYVERWDSLDVEVE